MRNQLEKGILVVNSHAGLRIPKEINPEWLSDSFENLVLTTNDLYTDILYNITDILKNKQLIFPYTPVIVNSNRDPLDIDQSVPLKIRGLPVYKIGLEPSIKVRRAIIQKYHLAFHRQIARSTKSFILDAHSTVNGDIDEDGGRICEDIILDDFQQSDNDPVGGIHTAPPGYLETYADELTKLLSKNTKIACNSRYTHVYGHVMAMYSWDGTGKRNNRVPLLLQETNERLYIDNGVPVPMKIAELQQAFASALRNTLDKMGRFYDF